MGKSKRDSRGFTLIAALLLTVLLSGIAVGLLYMVSNEERMGGNDLEGSLAFYGAESGIENLTAQLSQLYQTVADPKLPGHLRHSPQLPISPPRLTVRTSPA